MDALLANRYQVIKALASGGFGKTFLAQDTHMPSKRYCVIKQLQPITDNHQVYEVVKEKFQREAAILERLGSNSHQIPKLYAYFEADGLFYLVQEYIEGNTLTNIVQQQGKLNSNAVEEISIELLPVLSYVHSQHIIHRDIKPDNIIVRKSDNLPVLIDFGAIREAMTTVLSPNGSPTSSIVIGTPGFMPSEQSIGRPMYASDIYALGLTAIYLLTAKLPADLPIDPMTGKVLWQQYALGVSLSLANVLDKAIHSNPTERFLTAQGMLEALQIDRTATLATTVPTIIPDPTQVVNQSINQTQGNNFLKMAAFGGIITLIAISALGGLAYYYISQQTEPQPQSSISPQPDPIDTTPQESPTINNTPLLSYQSSCGSPPSDNTIWYAVKGDDRALDIVKNNYCGDALINRNSLQVASFNSEQEARDFAQKLSSVTGYNFWTERKDLSETTNPPQETQESSSSENTKPPQKTQELNSDEAISLIQELYNVLSRKDFARAREFYGGQAAEQFTPSFFEQFEQITAENLQIVSQTGSAIHLIGYNTYVYFDGSTQREERSYVVQPVEGKLKVTSSKFIKVVKFR